MKKIKTDAISKDLSGLWLIDLTHIEVFFCNKQEMLVLGKMSGNKPPLGRACYRDNRIVLFEDYYELIRKCRPAEYARCLRETVTHEYAHFAAHLKYRAVGHDKIWRDVFSMAGYKARMHAQHGDGSADDCAEFYNLYLLACE